MSGTLAALVLEQPAAGHGMPVGVGTWRFVAEIAIPDQSAARWDVSLWDDGLWSDGLAWWDLSGRVRGCTWKRGASTLAARPETGTATLELDNVDGYVSGWSPATLFPAVPYLLPGSTVRVGWWDPDNLAWLPAFTGTLEGIDEHAVELDADVWATLTLAETTAVLAAYNGPEQAPQGSGEYPTARFPRLCADASWPYGLDLSDVGPHSYFLLQPTALASNRLAEVYLTADSTVSVAASARDGRLQVRGRDSVFPWSYLDLGGDVALGERETVTPGGRTASPWASAPDISTNTDDLVNDVTAARAGGHAIQRADLASVARYKARRSAKRLDLILSDDGGVSTWIDMRLAQDADRVLHLSAITLDGFQTALLFGAVLDLDHGARVEVFREWVRWEGAFTPMVFGCTVLGYEVDMAALAPNQITLTAAVDLRVDTATAYPGGD